VFYRIGECRVAAGPTGRALATEQLGREALGIISSSALVLDLAILVSVTIASMFATERLYYRGILRKNLVVPVQQDEKDPK